MSDLATIENLLRSMGPFGASDLHLKVGLPPIYRVDGTLRMLQGVGRLTAGESQRMMAAIIPPALYERFERDGDLDFSFFLESEDPVGPDPGAVRLTERFRCNAYRSGGSVHGAIRRVPPEIPTFESLHLPPEYQQILDRTQEGLILVAGVTGSGKSTTLACMLERINETRSTNIVTVEDPVEFHINPRKSIVSQREIGVDVPSYQSALRHIVRQDPDVIFIGELRDHETVQAAIQAAETGHLVLGSIHSADVISTFARITEFFPELQRDFIRSALANSLQAIFAQRLLPATEDSGLGLVPATEVMTINSSIREMIRDGNEPSIATVIQSSEQGGMRSFNRSLAELVDLGHVTLSVALEYAPNRETLSSTLKGVEVKSSLLTGKIRA